MRTATFLALCWPALACSTSTEPYTGASGRPDQGGASGASASGTASGSASGVATGSGAETASGSPAGSGAASTGASTGAVAGSGAGSGASAGAPASGSTASSGTLDVEAGLPPGSVNMVPAGYTGTPFTQNVIPGFVYIANYDSGGAGVAYCHAAAGQTTAAECASAIKLSDWCCGTNKGCDDRSQNQGACPIYRADDDNAGLSHMNQGEPDDYATTGPSWAAGANGPTLTGSTVMAGTPVPQDATTTMVQDVYLSYTYTAEWLKFTVQVLSAGTYSIGGLMGVPGGTSLSLDFGGGITATFTPQASPCKWTGCPETYHSWNNVSNLGSVTFPAPGTYLMTFTIVQGTINPLYFTFTKM